MKKANKIPKKAQVAFNQFIFDTMMQKIREVELLEKDISHLRGIVDALQSDIESHAHTGLMQRISALENGGTALLRDVVANHSLRIAGLEKEIKDQREDYHAHIRQLVEENKAAHQILIASIETLQTQASNLESQIAALTNELLKLRDAAKKKSGRPKTVKK